jgi:allantoate deiminase
VEAGEPARASTGNIQVQPGLFNVVADHCELWMEMRHVVAARLEALATELDRRCRAIAARRRVGLVLQEVSRQEPQALSAELVEAACALAREWGLPHRVMPSGAAHDTMLFARAGIPALLVFVPSRRGISHSPEEFTSPEDLWTGYCFVRELARRAAGAA